MQWYYVANGERVGPIDETEFQALVHRGSIEAGTLVWNKTMKDWTKYGVAEKPSSHDPTPPSNRQAPSPNEQAVSPNEQAVSSPAIDIKNAACSQCGLKFSKNDMIQYENNWVCAYCKPIFIQKLKEGIHVDGTLDYAGFWIRFAAIFLDGLILGFLQLIIIFPAGAFIMSRFLNVPTNSPPNISSMGPVFALQALLWLVQLSMAMAYETWFVGKYGATPGKMACRIKVVMADGSPVSYMRAFGRYLAKFISYVVLLIGFIMAGFDKEKRALHDHICETRVIKK